MNKHILMPSCAGKIIFAAILAFSATGIAFAGQESSIITYDGKDFTRSQTTLVKEDGKSAANTKLDRESPAYKALSSKHSYTGQVAVFGQKCDASYAPLMDAKGQLTGALFVGNCKK